MERLRDIIDLVEWIDRPHEVLGVAADAAEPEIKAAWRALVKQHHPDAGGSEEMIKKINHACDLMLQGQAGGGSGTKSKKKEKDSATWSYEPEQAMCFSISEPAESRPRIYPGYEPFETPAFGFRPGDSTMRRVNERAAKARRYDALFGMPMTRSLEEMLADFFKRTGMEERQLGTGYLDVKAALVRNGASVVLYSIPFYCPGAGHTYAAYSGEATFQYDDSDFDAVRWTANKHNVPNLAADIGRRCCRAQMDQILR